MIRLFVSLELPWDVREYLARLCCDLPGARWVDPEQFHMTLRFIGEVEGHVFQEVSEALGTVRAEPFELEIRGAGHFPPRGKPRALWAGIERVAELELLQQRIESVLRRIGLPAEGRNFFPHVTLARLKNSPARAVGSFLSQNGMLQAGPWPVDRFWLYSSQLSPKRAIHRPEVEYPLHDGVG